MGLSKEELCKRVGYRLRELRLDKGLTIEKLAHESGLDYTQISRIELGKINTSIFQLYNITITLDVPIRDVFIDQ
jgi:transcriptional regulator with XRE-family HTH domain